MNNFILCIFFQISIHQSVIGKKKEKSDDSTDKYLKF